MPPIAPDPASRRRPGRPLHALVALNLALLVVLGLVVHGGGEARAQFRRAGDYLMVAGGVSGRESDVVYLIDTVNEEMVVLGYDTPNRKLDGLAFRNLAADMQQAGRSSR